MSQMMVSARSENKGIALNCPHCSFTCRHDVSHVEDCIKLGESLVCVACGEEFWLVTMSQTRVAEQRDAPVHAAIELLRKLKNDDDKGLDYISEETWEEINAVLKTAAGG